LAVAIFPLLLFKHNINNKNINNRKAPLRETKILQKLIFFTYKLPPKPQHGRTKLSLKPQHRYPLNPNMLKGSYPLNPNIRSAVKREILMGLSRNFFEKPSKRPNYCPLNPNMLKGSYPLNPNIAIL
jgi:hypothetical protein